MAYLPPFKEKAKREKCQICQIGNVEKLGTVKTVKKKVVKQTGFFQISNRAKNYFLNIFLKS